MVPADGRVRLTGVNRQMPNGIVQRPIALRQLVSIGVFIVIARMGEDEQSRSRSRLWGRQGAFEPRRVLFGGEDVKQPRQFVRDDNAKGAAPA